MTGRARTSSSQLLDLEQELSERDRAVLDSLRQFRLMTSEQLRRLHFVDHTSSDSSARICRRVLRRLSEQRLVGRLQRRIGGVRAGSSGHVYSLAPLGHRLIDGSTRYWREPSLVFVNHTLAIAELATGAVAGIRDQGLELVELQTEPRVWRPYLDGLNQQTLKPDLLLRLADEDYESAWFIEVDLGTESKTRLRAKCQAYLDYWASGEEQARHGYFPKVLWVAPQAARVQAIESVIAQLGQLDHQAELFEACIEDDAATHLLNPGPDS